MNRFKNIISTLLILFCSFPLVARTTGDGGTPQPSAYTLQMCQELAKEYNAKLKIKRNERNIAKQEKKEIFTNFLPSISLSGGGLKADDGLLQMPMGGTTLKMVEDGLWGGVSATLPIYAGGQIYNGNKLAQLGLEVSDLLLRQTENEVELTVEQYFWQVVVLREKLHTLENMQALLNRIGSDAEAAVKAGIKNRNDFLQVQLRKNEIESACLNVKNNIEVCKLLLAQYIGAADSNFEIVYDKDEALQTPESLFVNHSDALDLTTEYQLLQKNVTATKLKKRVELGQYLPTVVLGGGYLYHDFMGPSQNSFMGLVNVSIPISWKAPFSVKKHKLKQQNALFELEDGSEQLMIRMQKSQIDLINAYKQALIAQSSIEQSAENLRLNEDYYKVGTSSMSDLLDAQMIYQQSQEKYIEALAQYQIAKQTYLQATGR